MPGYDKLLAKVGLKSGCDSCPKKGGMKRKSMKKGGMAHGKKHSKGGMSCGMKRKSMKKGGMAHGKKHTKGGMKHKTMKKLHPRKVHHKKPKHMKLRAKTMKMKKGMKAAPKGLLSGLRKSLGL
jgi:hypothetical protein